jgi:hypothetical protein
MLIFTGKGMMNQWIRDYPLFRQTVLSKKILDIMVTGSSRYGPIRSHSRCNGHQRTMTAMTTDVIGEGLKGNRRFL